MLDEVRGHWGELLKLAVAENPELAGRLRQGSVAGIRGQDVHISFDRLFAKHGEFLAQDENRFACEQLFEKIYGRPARLHFELSGGSAGDDGGPAPSAAADGDVEQDWSRHRADPRVQVLQKVFKAKIRGVLHGTPAPRYHLGHSCNFNEDAR